MDNVTDQISDLWHAMTRWITDHSGQIALAITIGVGLVGILLALQWLGSRLAHNQSPWRATVGRALAAMRLWFMIALAAELVSAFAHAPPDLARTINVVFTVAACVQSALILRELILGAIEIRANAADSNATLGNAIGLIRVLVTAFLAVVAIILILTNLGIDATGLLAGLGIGGIAIGLAAQGIFADLFAALSILFDQPFRRGDTIRFESTSGTVEAIGLKSTRIRALSGEEVIISNTNLLSKEVRNFTRAERRRVFQVIGLIYQTTPAQCAALPDRLAALVGTVPGCEFVRAGLASFAASSLDFDLVYDIQSDDPDAILAVKHAINLAILRDFDSAGLSFAYPTQTTFTAAPDGRMVMPYATPPPQPIA
ncbi:MAG: mechanosensitive ion channel family protein [Sphingomonadaceae bacterium]